MSANKTPTINLTEHVANIVFSKAEESIPSSGILTLEQRVLYNHQENTKIRVQSVALPPNYSPDIKTEVEVMDWFRNKIHSNWSSAYSLALKYEKKIKIKLEQKKPYSNN